MTGVVVNRSQVSQVADSSHNHLLSPNVKLKQRKLWIGTFISDRLDSLFFPLPSDSWLTKFISRDISLVNADPEIGEANLKQLANKCIELDTFVLLELPRTRELPQRRNAIAWSVKRIIDWVAALVILIILSPVMLVLAATIAYTSSGSIFFHQWRVGQGGRLFQIIKFRSMISNADQLHHQVMSGQTGLHKCEDDPRVTSIGRWMRKYSLDELPQLFNVLRGEMSLVGPRPWALYDALRISGNGKRRLNCTPGVTGAWQVSARSTMLDIDAVTDCDLNYLRNWNLWMDLKILLMTVPKVLSGFGAF
ncbi:sugar transferase [Pseudanabaena biceps]|nr:sugar transferase [Pseudanabaena biceps]